MLILCVRLNNFLGPFCGIPVVFFVLITIFLACNKIFEIKILVHVLRRHHISYTSCDIIIIFSILPEAIPSHSQYFDHYYLKIFFAFYLILRTFIVCFQLQMGTLQSRLDAEFLLAHMCSVKFKEWIVVLATLLRRTEV